MRASESTAKLTEALSKAQGVMKAPVKDKTAKAGSFSYSYADLARVFDSMREPFAQNGLAVAQTMDNEGAGPVLLTRLLHVSGEWIEGAYPIPLNLTGQQLGSALTYARRYSLSAITGLAADDDDDGASAEKERPKPPVSSPKRLTMLIDAAKEAARNGTLNAFRESADIKREAATLSPADLATLKATMKELGEIAK